MNYIQLRKFLADFTVFSIRDVRRIDPKFHRRRLNEWQDKGYIKKIIKGFYIFSDLELNENTLFEIANRIYNPSYISFEMALAYYHLIPESTYGITSASTRRTYKFKSLIAEFHYRTIKTELFFGYVINGYNGKCFKIATPEKAILDYFYLNPHIYRESDFASLRMNSEVFFQKVKTGKLNSYLKKFSKNKLSVRVNNFLDFMNAQR
ncbi:MAG: hypothetical protein ACE5LC_08295 [Candidatus Aminicenantales bacterium]